jgi:hypothetical protein
MIIEQEEARRLREKAVKNDPWKEAGIQIAFKLRIVKPKNTGRIFNH